MKSRQLLSVVFSLIMFTGVTAGNTAFAESDDLDDILEDFCEFDVNPETFFEQNPDLADFSDEITDFCELDENERDIAIEEFIIDNFPDAIEEDDEVIEDFEDCVEAGGVIGDNLDECTLDDMIFVNDEDDDDDDVIDSYEDCVEAGYPVMESFPEQCMTDDGTSFVNDDDDSEDDLDKVLVCHKDKNTLSIAHDALRAHLAHGDHEGHCDDDTRADHDEYSNEGPGNLRDRLATFCDFTAEERAEKLEAMHDDLPDDLRADHLRYCEMSEDEQDSFRDRMMDKMDVMRDHMKDQMHDKMTDKPPMDYDRLCAMTESERAAEIDDSEKLDRISDWCEMTPEEREDYKDEHHDEIKEKVHDKMEKFSDKSDRLKAMIMDKRDISDERHDEIKMKFESKFGEDSDKKRTEIKMKYKDHMRTMKFEMSDERRSDVHDRLAEMKAYKAELRENSSEMTDLEKQQLREEFIEKAKDMQLAWISPRTQMTAGIDSAEVECREGFSLVMKASNGVAMCLHADSALKMIDRGIVVPAN